MFSLVLVFGFKFEKIYENDCTFNSYLWTKPFCTISKFIMHIYYHKLTIFAIV